VIALTSIPVSIGFSVGVALAPRGGDEKAEQIQGGGGDLLVAAAGALVFALNIAPTAEPILVAAELDGVRLGLERRRRARPPTRADLAGRVRALLP
jgi:uncharacterized membrane protein